MSRAMTHQDLVRLMADAESIAHRVEVYGSREGRGTEAANMIRKLLAIVTEAESARDRPAA